MSEHDQIHRCNLSDTWINTPMQWKDFHAWILNSVQEKDIILDAGAGEGKAQELFKGKDCKYIGVDSYIGSDDWDYSQVTKADLKNLDFITTGTVNIVLLIQVLEHLEDPDSIIQEISRVMVPKGNAFVSVPQSQGVHQVPFDYWRYTPYGIRSLFQRHGLRLKLIAPQLNGDLGAASSFLVWALQSAKEDAHTPLNKFLIAVFLLVAKVAKRILKYPDQEIKRHKMPIGYFVWLEKI